MEAIKAIPTVYKGVEFRSKLEAQWAKWLTAMKIAWAYEPEGYEFEDGTRYLPDFYLCDAKEFFEVKGVMTDKDMNKIQKMLYNGYPIAVGYANGEFRSPSFPFYASKKDKTLRFELSQPDYSSLCICKNCGSIIFSSNGYPGQYCNNCHNADQMKFEYISCGCDNTVWNEMAIDARRIKNLKERDDCIFAEWENWTIGGRIGEVSCSNCGHSLGITSNVHNVYRPSICPNCNAVMTNAED